MHFFSMIDGMPSGPAEQDDFNFEVALVRQESSTDMMLRDCPFSGTLLAAAETWEGVVASLTNVLENLSANRWHMSSYDEASSPSNDIEDGSPCSFRCSLMGFQKPLGFFFSLRSVWCR